MNKSESIKNLAKALCDFQGKVGKIKKEATNPFFKKKYATLSNILDVIQTPLNEAGLCFTQFPEGENSLTSILMHSDTGEFIEGSYDIHPVKNDPQSVGSAITYARRYALGAMLGLNIDDDDDGNAASGKEPEKQKEVKDQIPPDIDMKQWADFVDACTTVEELTKKEQGNIKTVTAVPAIKKLFENKKIQLLKTVANGSKNESIPQPVQNGQRSR